MDRLEFPKDWVVKGCFSAYTSSLDCFSWWEYLVRGGSLFLVCFCSSSCRISSVYKTLVFLLLWFSICNFHLCPLNTAHSPSTVVWFVPSPFCLGIRAVCTHPHPHHSLRVSAPRRGQCARRQPPRSAMAAAAVANRPHAHLLVLLHHAASQAHEITAVKVLLCVKAPAAQF